MAAATAVETAPAAAQVEVTRHRPVHHHTRPADLPYIRPPWSDDEADYLQREYAYQPLAAIAAHLGRSVQSVRTKARRMACGRYGDGDLTLRDVGVILGRDEKTVRRWLVSGRLRGKQGPAEGERPPFWHITQAELRRFVKHHPTEASDHMDTERFVRLVAGLPAGKDE